MQIVLLVPVQSDKIEAFKITSDDVDNIKMLIPKSLKPAKGTFEIY